jgi:hypothetical protein
MLSAADHDLTSSSPSSCADVDGGVPNWKPRIVRASLRLRSFAYWSADFYQTFNAAKTDVANIPDVGDANLSSWSR